MPPTPDIGFTHTPEHALLQRTPSPADDDVDETEEDEKSSDAESPVNTSDVIFDVGPKPPRHP